MIIKKPSLILIFLSIYFLPFISYGSSIDESVNQYLAPISNFVAVHKACL